MPASGIAEVQTTAATQSQLRPAGINRTGPSVWDHVVRQPGGRRAITMATLIPPVAYVCMYYMFSCLDVQRGPSFDRRSSVKTELAINAV